MTHAQLKKKLEMLRDLGVSEYRDDETGLYVRFQDRPQWSFYTQPSVVGTTGTYPLTGTGGYATAFMDNSSADVYDNPMTFPGGRVPSAFPKKGGDTE